jgi:hypothetical protein
VNDVCLVDSKEKNKTPGAEVKAAQTAVIYTKKTKRRSFLAFENGLNAFCLPKSPFPYRNSGLP